MTKAFKYSPFTEKSHHRTEKTAKLVAFYKILIIKEI